jgi:amino acid transporter
MTMDGEASIPTYLREEEERVEARSAAFRKELGLRDVVLAQVLIVMGLSGLGMAAKLGPSSLVVWLLAITLFYVPLAVVVIHLNRLVPLEGGLYQWAKLGLGEFVGYMVAWNNFLFVILFISSIGLSTATALSYAAGPRGAWMAGSKWLIAATGFVLVGAMMLVAGVGLRVGKWINNAGGAIFLCVFVGLLLLPLLNASRVAGSGARLQLVMPALTLLNLTILVKIAGYGMGGFEYVAIFAGECRRPARTLSRSVVIAAPVIAVLYILCTGSVLAFVRPEDVDLINPAAQVLSLGLAPFSVAAYVMPVVILMLMVRDITQTTCIYTGGTRLPMVAGWDDLLPAWFTRLHPKYRTPVNSIIFLGVVAFGLGLLSLTGVGQQEAYQLLESASGIFVVSGYLALFAIPLVGMRGKGVRWPLWVRLASVSGFVMTLMFVALSVFPIIDVESWLSYGIKIGGVIVVADLLGAAIYLNAGRKRRREASVARDSAAV